MGTLQLLLVFLSFILFGYFVVISNQRDELYLIESAKEEMFDNMVKIGDLANEYYLQNTAQEPDVLQTIYLPFTSSGTVTTMILQSGELYIIKISGVIIFPNGEINDPWYWWTQSNSTPHETGGSGVCNYLQLSGIGNPNPYLYNPAHVYEWSVLGSGTTKTFTSGGCVGLAGNNTFTIEISRPGGTPSVSTNSYDGFECPQYLVNRPYCDIDYEIINDTLIYFTGRSNFEDSVYMRQCTPSNSMGLIQ